MTRLKVPVVFITGHDDAPTLERIAKSSAAGHLRKPFDRTTVLDTIRRAVGPIEVDGSHEASHRDEGEES